MAGEILPQSEKGKIPGTAQTARGCHEWTDSVTARKMGTYGSPIDVVPPLRFIPERGDPKVAEKGPLGDLLCREILRLAAENERLKLLGGFDRAGAERLADEVASLVARGLLDSRSAAADALLDYREPPRTSRSDRLAALEEEPARIRRELLAALPEHSRCGCQDGQASGERCEVCWDCGWAEATEAARAALDRICPAEVSAHPSTEMEVRMAQADPEDEAAYTRAYQDGKAQGRTEGEEEERDRIRQELLAWLVGDIFPRDAGNVGGRRIVAEIDRICPAGPEEG